jgi:hypothetical protein
VIVVGWFAEGGFGLRFTRYAWVGFSDFLLDEVTDDA